MEIYLVMVEHGSYDDYRDWVAGVFDTREAANSLAEIITKEHEQAHGTECPVDENKEDEWTDEDHDKWYKWIRYVHDAPTFKEIVACNMNERIIE